MSFRVEYQYSSWKGRDEEGEARWWLQVDKAFKSKSSRTRFINKMNKEYRFIEYRMKNEIVKDRKTVMKRNEGIIVYTDGSAHYKDKLGGIGVYLKFNGKEGIISRGYSHTTNNRMEMRAVIEAMKAIKDKTTRVDIYSDSELVVNSFNKWIEKWEKEEWIGRKNVDLLKEGIREWRNFPEGVVNIHWLKGHSGIEGNEIADILAGEGRVSGQYIHCDKSLGL